MAGNNNSSDVCSTVIKSYYSVYNTLGYGFVKDVYVNALAVELEKCKLEYDKQRPINVYYNNISVGEFCVDLLVDGQVLIEIKVVDELNGEDEQQLFNHLKATGTEVGLLLNFGKKPEFKRKLYI
jgi:GxxExxY protein